MHEECYKPNELIPTMTASWSPDWSGFTMAFLWEFRIR